LKNPRVGLAPFVLRFDCLASGRARYFQYVVIPFVGRDEGRVIKANHRIAVLLPPPLSRPFTAVDESGFFALPTNTVTAAAWQLRSALPGLGGSRRKQIRGSPTILGPTILGPTILECQ
jgi:hypothetical protein